MKKWMALMLTVLMILSTAVFSVSAQEDITASTQTFALNKNSVNAAGSKIASNSHATNYIVVTKGNYAEYIIHTEKAAEYEFILNVGGSQAGVLVDVSVNGVLTVDNKELIVTGAYMNYTDNVMGNIILRPGENRILITNDATSKDSIVATAFRLKYVADAKYAPMSYQLNTNTVADYSHAWIEQCSDKFITLNRNGSQYVEYTIPAAEAGLYTLSVNSGGKSAGVLLDVSVGGTVQLQNAEFPEVTGDYQMWADQELGNITLENGDNLICFSMPAASTAAAVIRYFTLTKVQTGTEEITADPMVFPLNNQTVDLSHADPKNSGTSHITLQKTNYIEYPIYTLQSKKYIVTFTGSAVGTTTTMTVSVNGKEVLSKVPMIDSVGHGTRLPNMLGVIQLNPGQNVIKFQVAGGATVATRFELRAFTEHINEKQTEFALNKNTTQNFTGVSSDYYADCITLWESNSVEYVVMTEKAGDYNFALKVGTAAGVAIKMSISVNGEKLQTPTVTDGTGYGTRTYHNFGSVALKSGLNIIKIANENVKAVDGHSAAVVTHFKLTALKEDITANPMVFPLNNKTVDLSHADSKNSADTHATMQKGQYIEYVVNTKKDAYYLLSLTAGVADDITKLNVFMNGNAVINQLPLENTGGYGTRLPHDLGMIFLPAGETVFKFQPAGSAIVSTQFTLEKKRLDHTITVNGASAEANVNVSEAGMYGITAKTTSADNGVVRVSVNGTAVAGIANGAGELYLGKLYLAEGTQTVTIATTS